MLMYTCARIDLLHNLLFIGVFQFQTNIHYVIYRNLIYNFIVNKHFCECTIRGMGSVCSKY